MQVNVGNGLGMRTAAVLSCMDGTIGRCVGNSLEVIESLETLKGKGPADLMELVTTLGNDFNLFFMKLTWLFGGFDALTLSFKSLSSHICTSEHVLWAFQ